MIGKTVIYYYQPKLTVKEMEKGPLILRPLAQKIGIIRDKFSEGYLIESDGNLYFVPPQQMICIIEDKNGPLDFEWEKINEP